MDYLDITCILGLAAVACFGFFVIALALYWPNEANVYLLVFCLANGALAVVGAFEVNLPDHQCRWNAALRMFCLTLGFEMLSRSQVERNRMSVLHFRLYNKRAIYSQLLRSSLISGVASFAPWNLYDYNATFQTCFIKASGSAKLEETMISFFWVLFCYVRSVALTTRWIPRILCQTFKQIRVLRHERELELDSKLLLYKDHHRRLFHVISSMGSEVLVLLWIVLTLPYVLQVVGAVAGLSTFMRLEEMSSWQLTAFSLTFRLVPIASCLVVLSIYVTYFCVKMKS